jgi:hypothetical protein
MEMGMIKEFKHNFMKHLLQCHHNFEFKLDECDFLKGYEIICAGIGYGHGDGQGATLESNSGFGTGYGDGAGSGNGNGWGLGGGSGCGSGFGYGNDKGIKR